MKRQALILQIRKYDAIILSEDHDYYKIRRQPGFAVGQSIQFSPEDVIQPTMLREGFSMKKKWVTVAASLILVVAVGVVFASFGLIPKSNPTGTTAVETTAIQSADTAAPSTALAAKPVVAVLAIDINPSLELQLAADGTVVAFKAMNQDAEKLQLGALIGMPAEAAIETIITVARQAGFINSNDDISDFVLLAEVPLDATATEAEPLYAMIQTRLQERIRNNEALQNVEMVMLRATEQQMTQAHKDNIGLGLQIINQNAVQAGLGEAKTVREFFANRERLQLAQTFCQQEGYMWQGKYGGSGEDGPGKGTQEQNRETTGTANQGETTGSGTANQGETTGNGSGNQGETTGSGTGNQGGTTGPNAGNGTSSQQSSTLGSQSGPGGSGGSGN